MKDSISLWSAVLLLLGAAVSCEMPSTGRGSVSGVVTQTSTGEPVEGVRVVYANIVKFTDDLGRYSIDTIPDGLQGITFSKMGFTTLVSQVDIQRDAPIEHDVSISVMTGGWAVGAVETEYATIFHTEDGGATWVRQGTYTVVPPDDLLCLCAVDQNCCWVAGDTTFNVLRNRMEYSILKTSDRGETWRRQGQTIGNLTPCPIVGITAIDTTAVFAVTDTNIILMGTGGGESWKMCHTSDHTASYSAISTPDGTHIWAGGSPVEGGSTGLDYSADGGSTWSFIPVIQGVSEEFITDICAVDTCTVYVSGSFGLARTSDGGASWERVPGSGAGGVNTVTALGSYNVWTGLNDGSLVYTWDAFRNAEAGVLDAPCQIERITAISFLGDATEGALTYTSGSKTVPGGVLFTLDWGRSWSEAVTPYKVALHEISFAGTRH